MAIRPTLLHLHNQGDHPDDEAEDAYAEKPNDAASDLGYRSQADDQQKEMGQV